MSKAPLTLDQDAMNERVKSEHPDAYRDAFAAQRLATISGASIIVFPLGGLMTIGSISGTNGLDLSFAEAAPWGVGIGFALAAVLNLVYFSRRRTEDVWRQELLYAAEDVYPDTVARIDGERLVFTRRN